MTWITAEELFTIYWSQTVLILGFIVGPITYFVKRHFDLKVKKFEIKHSLFQQEKIKAINDFISTYIESELFWLQLDHYAAIDQRRMSSQELDNAIIPLNNKFLGSFYKLYLLLHEDELVEFDLIVQSIKTIRNTLADLRYHKGMYDTDLSRNNEYVTLVYKTARENRELLKVIGIKFRLAWT